MGEEKVFEFKIIFREWYTLFIEYFDDLAKHILLLSA